MLKYFLLSAGKRILKKSSFVQAIKNLRSRIKNESKGRFTEDYPGLEFVTCAAALAHHRMLGPVDFIRLGDVDLSTVPTHHLASLVSSDNITAVMIQNVTGCDLVSLIDSLKCTCVGLGFQCLGMEVTQSLVRAMESRLLVVDLNLVENLDIEALAEYSGQGLCWMMDFSYSFSEKFFDDLITWASRKNWMLNLTTEVVRVEDKIRRVYKLCLFGDLTKYKQQCCHINQADVTTCFVNSFTRNARTPLAKKIDESSLTGDLGRVSGLSGLMERLRLASNGNNTETTQYWVAFVKEATPEAIIIDIKEATPVEETPRALVTEAKQVNPVKETSAADIKEPETINVATEVANYEKAANIKE